MIFDDTIAAISTPAGAGAIAVVRLSGPNAYIITDSIFFRGKSFESASKAPLTSHQATHGFIIDPVAENLLDEVVVVPYKGPNSYTGEDLVEISCHGSTYITNTLLNLCVRQGARLAKPGEFTQRAFLHGRLDLTQAEAVLDLIQSKTGRQNKQALSALGGDIGKQIRATRDRLVELLSRVVAGIDFPEEVGEIALDDVSDVVESTIATLEKLALTVRTGRFLREGVKLAIVGKPNAGKSSLLNQLLNFERAIVTDIPGTTRDSLEEMLDLNGIPVILVDTAGIRTTSDHVERIGIERTYKAVEDADLVLMVCDVNNGWTTDDDLIAKMLENKPHLMLGNKCDIAQSTGKETVEAAAKNSGAIASVAISAKFGTGIDQLSNEVERWVFSDQRTSDAGASLNARQGELCTRAVEALRLVENTVENDMPQDCLATDLKTAVDCLSEICGEAVSEEIITNVFATFCIGK